MKTIGIVGYMQNGKDTVAEIIQKELFPKTVEIVHFADPLKELARQIGWDGRKDKKGRWFLQRLGVLCRGLKKDYWVDKMRSVIHKQNARSLDFLLIPDLRFANEAEMLNDYYSEIIVVKRPIKGWWRRLWFWIKPRHCSEKYHKWINKYPHTVIINDGTIDDLKEKLSQKLQEWQEIA